MGRLKDFPGKLASDFPPRATVLPNLQPWMQPIDM